MNSILDREDILYKIYFYDEATNYRRTEHNLLYASLLPQQPQLGQNTVDIDTQVEREIQYKRDEEPSPLGMKDEFSHLEQGRKVDFIDYDSSSYTSGPVVDSEGNILHSGDSNGDGSGEVGIEESMEGKSGIGINISTGSGGTVVIDTSIDKDSSTTGISHPTKSSSSNRRAMYEKTHNTNVKRPYKDNRFAVGDSDDERSDEE